MLVDEGRAVHRHVHDAAPHAKKACAADDGHDRHATFADIFDHRQIAALGVGVVAVDIATEDEAALVGLADIKMPRAEGDHTGDHRLQSFGDECLENVAFDGQPHPCLRHDTGR